MIRHFLKVAYRSLLRKGKMSLLNIVGLSLGIASTLVIGLALAVAAATLYNRPKLIFGSS